MQFVFFVVYASTRSVQNGPKPMHDVVVSAVRKAVSAAIKTFAASSMKFSFFIVFCDL